VRVQISSEQRSTESKRGGPDGRALPASLTGRHPILDGLDLSPINGFASRKISYKKMAGGNGPSCVSKQALGPDGRSLIAAERTR
jgi:hypothetical protein